MSDKEKPTTESLRRRGRTVDPETGLVEGTDWHAGIFGVCGFVGLIVVLIVKFLG